MFDNLRYWWEEVDKKKFFLISAILLLLVVLFYLVYLVFKPAEPSTVNNLNGNNAGFPQVGEGNANYVNNIDEQGLPSINNENVGNNGNESNINEAGGGSKSSTGNTTLLTVGEAKGITTLGGDLKYYSPEDCRFHQIDKDGNNKIIGSESYCQVEQLTWSDQGNQAILEFPDGSNVVYNFDKDKQYTLPKEMQEFSFSPDGSQIAGKYMGDNFSDRWVAAVKSDGTGLSGIEPMGDNADKVNVQWSGNNQVVALSRTGEPSGAFTQQVLLIGFNGENFKSLYVNGRGFEPKWSPDGKKILYSSYSDKTNYKPTLTLVNGEPDKIGTSEKQFDLYTWADKCNVTNDFAYCAVPTNMPEGSGFVRELASGSSDQIWRIDIKNGTANLLATPIDDQGQNMSVNDINISDDGQWVYFKDNATGQLKAVKVK